jgi:hypothetical protein
MSAGMQLTANEFAILRLEEKRTIQSETSSRASTPTPAPPKPASSPGPFAPYQDDPDEPFDEGVVLQTQKQLMDGVYMNFLFSILVLHFRLDNRSRRPLGHAVIVGQSAARHRDAD